MLGFEGAAEEGRAEPREAAGAFIRRRGRTWAGVPSAEITAENLGWLLLCSASEKEGLPCGVAVSGKERANGRAGL